MRCLYKECPMFGRRTCPATSTCPEYRRCVGIKVGIDYLELSPEEAVDLYRKLEKFIGAADIRDHGNPPDYWPSHHDAELTEDEFNKSL